MQDHVPSIRSTSLDDIGLCMGTHSFFFSTKIDSYSVNCNVNSPFSWSASLIDSFLQKGLSMRFLIRSTSPAFPLYQTGSWEATRTSYRPLPYVSKQNNVTRFFPTEQTTFLKNCACCLHRRSGALGIIFQHFPALLFHLLYPRQPFHIHCGLSYRGLLIASKMKGFFFLSVSCHPYYFWVITKKQREQHYFYATII